MYITCGCPGNNNSDEAISVQFQLLLLKNYCTQNVPTYYGYNMHGIRVPFPLKHHNYLLWN